MKLIALAVGVLMVSCAPGDDESNGDDSRDAERDLSDASRQDLHPTEDVGQDLGSPDLSGDPIPDLGGDPLADPVVDPSMDPAVDPVTEPNSDAQADPPAEVDAVTTSGAPGSACSCDTDCAEEAGHEGLCVYGICMTLAWAACSAGGSTAECAAGSRCWGLSGADTALCWPDCESYDCDGVCDADGSCIPGEGQDCDPACGTFCTGSSGPGGGAIGAACNADGDCLDNDCYPQSAANGFIEGYCLQFECPTPGESCGNGGICISGLGSANVCMQQCDSGCRSGYTCVYIEEGGPTFCYPYCTGDYPCPSGYQCDDYTCVPDQACSTTYPDGFCPTGQTCVSGACQDNCSTTYPGGYCPAGFSCQGDRASRAAAAGAGNARSDTRPATSGFACPERTTAISTTPPARTPVQRVTTSPPTPPTPT